MKTPYVPPISTKAKIIAAQLAIGLPEAWKPCEDCNGTGIDSGSLNEPEPCKVCKGSKLAQPEGE